MAAETHPLASEWTVWMGDANEKNWKEKLKVRRGATRQEERRGKRSGRDARGAPGNAGAGER